MADVITPNFSSSGGGKPPVPPSDQSISELMFQLSRANDMVDQLTRALIAKNDESERLLEFLKAYDAQLTELLTGHVQQAHNAKRAAKQLEALRGKLLPGK